MVYSLIFYAIIITFSLCFASAYQKKSLIIEGSSIKTNTVKFKKNFLFLLAVTPPIFFGSIRFGIGTDYNYYTLIYNITNSLPINELYRVDMEALYLSLNLIANFFAPNEPWLVFFFTSVLTMCVLVIGLMYFKHSLSLSLSLFIYYMFFFFPSLNIQRQMLAVSIVILSFKFILEKRPFLFFITIMIASMFHNSAIISLFFYFLNFRRNKNYVLKKIVFYSLIFLFPFLILPLFEIGSQLPFFRNYFRDYTLNYVGISLSTLLDIMVVLTPVLLFKKQLVNKDPRNDFFINLSWLIIPITAISLFQTWAFRLRIYITISQIILFPMIVNLIKDKKERKVAQIIIFIVYISLFYLKFVIIGEDQVLPFRSYINLFNF